MSEMVAPNAWRRAAVLALAALLLTGCGESKSPAGDRPPAVTISSAPEDGDPTGDPDAVPRDPRFDAAGRAGDRALSRTAADSAWAVPDAVQRPLERLWNARRGAYVSPGGEISTRLNAEMLRIHASAARADHHGPSRHDDRIPRLVAYLTGPAYLASGEGERFGGSRHNAIHIPGWRQSSSKIVNQHPSIDATVARGLRTAWLAGGKVGLDAQHRAAIERTVVAVATSPAFRAPSRLLNQINWNADLYAAAATVSEDPELLREDYREQLVWFAEHAQKPVGPGLLPNLTPVGGFHYRPDGTGARDATVNRSDTVEYGNAVLGALRYYDEARRAGMQALDPDDALAMRVWATHTIEAGWAPSGYLNWETGKGASRLHLRQYWALALDGATMALRGASELTGRPTADGDRVLARGTRLFRRWSGESGTVLLPATAFGFPSRFISVRHNRVTTSVRLAATLAEWSAGCGCDGRLPAPAGETAPLRVSLDPQLRRLAVNGPRYATAISPTAMPNGGGLEPAWILDADGTMLGALGGGGDGSLGLELDRPGPTRKTLLDTQPGLGGSARMALTPVADQTDSFTGRIVAGRSVVRLTHHFTADAIRTSYAIDPRRTVDVTLRIPSTGRNGSVRCTPGDRESAAARMPGCAIGQEYLVRSAGGGTMRARIDGLPAGARVRVSRPRARSTAPRPGSEATIRFRTARRIELTRVLRPVAR